MERREGRSVGNGVDRERVEVVVDDVDKNTCPWRAGVPSTAAAEGDAKMEHQHQWY